MVELYNIKVSDAINHLVDDVLADQEQQGVTLTKAQAKVLVLNALMYNVVSCEVCNQVRYLCDQEIDG